MATRTKDGTMRDYLLEHWARIEAHPATPEVIKAFIRKERTWLKRTLARASRPGGLGK